MSGTLRVIFDAKDERASALVFASRSCCARKRELGKRFRGPCLAKKEGVPCGMTLVPIRTPRHREEGERLKAAREAAGLTWGDAARILGVRPSEACALERGMARPEGMSWEELAETLRRAS